MHIRARFLRSSIYFCLLILLLGSCKKKQLGPADYIKWVESSTNGFSVNKDLDDYGFGLLYKPVNYLLAKEMLSGALKKEGIDRRKSELGNMQYFTFRIKSKDANEVLSAHTRSQDEYYQRLEYFMNDFQNDIYLVEDADTIPCALSHFERSYGLAPYSNFIVAFKHSEKKDADKLFVYDDKLLGTGKVMLRIKSGDISKVPDITWN